MRLTLAASGFVAFLICMSVVQGENNWKVSYTTTQICALKGSTVEMSCSYTYPSRINGRNTTVEKMFWFSRAYDEPVDLMTDSEYSDRVQYSSNNNDCTLRISELRESDSAVYFFMFITNQPNGILAGPPGVNLSITDPQLHVQVIKAISHQGFSKAELKCHSRCRLPAKTSYVWYENGQKIQAETSSVSVTFDFVDSFSCALQGHEDSPSPAVCVDGRYCYKVTYDDRRICAFKGSSVDISCTYSSSHYPTSKLWFSPERKQQWQFPSQPEDLRKDSQRFEVFETTGRSTLRISDLRESDSAEYHFKFKTTNFEWKSSLPGTRLTVTDPDLQVQVTRSWFLSFEKLKCHSSCRLPDGSSYIWYENGQKIWRKSFSFTRYFYPKDSYSCAVKGFEDFPSPPVCVHGQTCNRVTYTDRSICAPKGSSVDISCTYSSFEDDVEYNFWFSPDHSPQWQNPSEPEDLMGDSQFAGRVKVLETKRGRSTLTLSDLTESDSAKYHFKFKTPRFEWRSSLPGTTLTVTALQVLVSRKRGYKYYTEAQLVCNSSCPPAGRLSYVWFKNGQKTMEGSSSYRGLFSPGDSISCALKGHENHLSPLMYALMDPSVLVSPSGEILEGSSVTLTCSSNANTYASNTWFKENQKLISEDPQLVFSSIQSSDSGEYQCRAENQLGRRTSEYVFINVNYAPKLPSVSVSPSAEIVEGSSVNLTCSSDANPAASYTWFKENQTKFEGPEEKYHFPSISSEDRGNYYCKSENQHGEINSTSLFLDVQYAPRLPSVSVSPSAEIVEGSSVNLTCSSDANPAASYTWFKEDEDSPRASGPTFTITNFTAEHSGNYHCEARNSRGRQNSTLHLIVLARALRSRAAGTTTVVVLAVVLLSVFILTRKKRAAEQSPEPGERLVDRKQRQPDDQHDLHYASVRFSDPLYSNIRPASLRRHKVEESVVYAEVKFKRAPRSQKFAGEDPAALYSNINKTCRT